MRTVPVGTGAMVRLALRRDRIMLPVWIASLTAAVVGTASSFSGLYPTLASRQQFASGIGANPALRALYGPGFDLTSVGGLTAWRIGGTGAVLVALMSVLVVVRHTRAEEEAGRLELLGSTVLGQRAALVAGLTVAVGADLVIAVLVGLGLTGLGLPAAGSFALGLSLAATGVLFGTVAAVTAQLTNGPRAANGMAGGVLGLSFLLRAVGDGVGPGGPLTWLTWLSPIGWIEHVRPFAGERWWVFGLVVAVAALCAGVAAVLVTRRDLGAGLLPARPGPAHGSAGLAGPFALAWRLHRGALLGWSVGLAAMGSLAGSVADVVGDLVNDNPQMAQVLERLGGQGGLADTYLAATMGIVGLGASGYAVQAMLRLRAEETASRAEPVLATPVGRTRWALSHLLFAGVGTAVLLGAVGLGAGLAHGLRTGEVGTQVPRLVGAALAQLPAAWVLVGVAVALVGLAPRAVVGGWAVLAACVLVGQLGPVLRFDQWVMDLSPFTHLPRLPGGTVTIAPMVWLVAVAAVLVVAGLAGLCRRDIG